MNTAKISQSTIKVLGYNISFLSPIICSIRAKISRLTVCVIIDVSGGMPDFHSFFDEIKKISDFATVQVVYYDCHPCGEYIYSKKDGVQPINCGGFGTDMKGAIEYSIKKFDADVYVLITDGYTDYPSKYNRELICCLTHQGGLYPSWGHAVDLSDPPKGPPLRVVEEGSIKWWFRKMPK